MSNLTMPTLTVSFKQKASTAVARSQKGTVALLLRDAAANAEAMTCVLTSTAQIPAELGVENQNAIRRVFLGGVNPPKKVLLYVMAAEAAVEQAVADAIAYMRPQLEQIDADNKQILVDGGMELIEYDDAFYQEILELDAVQALYDDIDNNQINGLGTKLQEALAAE